MPIVLLFLSLAVGGLVHLLNPNPNFTESGAAQHRGDSLKWIVACVGCALISGSIFYNYY